MVTCWIVFFFAAVFCVVVVLVEKNLFLRTPEVVKQKNGTEDNSDRLDFLDTQDGCG